jgi:NAD(P)-dependent dehydrogenase (short-subunit alcohol dehydrogenase family)
MVWEVIQRARHHALVSGGDSLVAQALVCDLLTSGWHVVLTVQGLDPERVRVPRRAHGVCASENKKT